MRIYLGQYYKEYKYEDILLFINAYTPDDGTEAASITTDTGFLQVAYIPLTAIRSTLTDMHNIFESCTLINTKTSKIIHSISE